MRFIYCKPLPFENWVPNKPMNAAHTMNVLNIMRNVPTSRLSPYHNTKLLRDLTSYVIILNLRILSEFFLLDSRLDRAS